MINPVIRTFNIFGYEFSLRWYGVIVMIGVIVGSLMIENALKRRGENPESIWDALVWWVSFGPVIKTPIGNFQLGLPIGVLPIGIIGARLWYVVNDILGGRKIYLEDPSRIYKVWEGGLHIFGGFLFGGAILLIFLQVKKLDPWLFLDAAGPAMLVGQAIGRIANFINQELYGPPTTLPWGIPIDMSHRLPQFQNLPADTRFHPAFAYEMLWNFIVAGVLIWLSRRYEKIKPGTIFAGWLVGAGTGRVWLELFFRPDQPKIGNSPISYSMVVAALMAIAGIIILLVRYKVWKLAFAENWEDEYHVSGTLETQVSPVEEKKPVRVKKVSVAETVVEDDDTPVKKATPRKAKSVAPKKTASPKTVKKTTPKTAKKTRKSSS